MEILIGTQTGTSYNVNAGTKTFTISGVTGLINKSTLKRVSILRGVERFFIIAPPIVNYTIALNTDIYTVDYSNILGTPLLQIGDILEIWCELSDKQQAIDTKLDILQNSVDQLSDSTVVYENTILVKSGSVCECVCTRDGFITKITGGGNILSIKKNNILQILPVSAEIGDVFLIEFSDISPTTLKITNSLNGTQIYSTQNRVLASSEFLYGVSLPIKSSYLNKSLYFTRQGTTALFNKDLSIEKVIYPSESLGTPSPNGNFMVMPKVVEIGPYIIYSTLPGADIRALGGLFKLDQTTLETTKLDPIRASNILKVTTTGGVEKLYVAANSGGFITYDPYSNAKTVINADVCICIYYHPILHRIYVIPASGGNNVKVYNPDDDSLETSFPLTNYSGYHPIAVPTLNRLFINNMMQNGGANVIVIRTDTQVQEAVLSVGNFFTSGIAYSEISGNIYINVDTGASAGKVSVINADTLVTLPITILLPAGDYYSMTHGNYLYVACYDSSTLIIIDVTTHEILESIILEGKPHHIYYEGDDNLIIILSQEGNSITALNPR